MISVKDANQDLPPRYCSSPPPSYSCTVYKQGHVKLKKEVGHGGTIEINRSWKNVYFRLRGTVIQVFRKETCDRALYTISMHKATCGIAADYKLDNVLRLRLGTTKEQFLLRPMGNLPETISWFEHLQSSANISTDIDKRHMPKILTLSRGSHHHHYTYDHLNRTRTITLTVGATQAIIPVLQCQINKSF